jgi:hypothetical protein
VTFKKFISIFVQSAFATGIAIVIAISISLCFVALFFQVSFDAIQSTLLKYQYGLGIAYIVGVLLVCVEQVVKTKNTGMLK